MQSRRADLILKLEDEARHRVLAETLNGEYQKELDILRSQKGALASKLDMELRQRRSLEVMLERTQMDAAELDRSLHMHVEENVALGSTAQHNQKELELENR